ncbi:uncharacterized protein LOC129595788 isoform X2 [Paramacrobiotus metropolitanus]|uniref:uncharacterized protein LOC129595788 isoform X2 n=1 Tax=Paramacrobiotus metropolitanus TaxID=2943436 RepID=UPI0024462FD7|nr:uncharacterized protein LOC129595788 isoform X2 [Paramacrobiotus metropolitanus]
MWRAVYLPNSVDILGDDGLLRYGRVVDVADNGLFIDFLCPNRRRELTAFGSIYLPTASEPLPTRGTNPLHAFAKASIPVEVLVRESLCGPWMWVPGEMNSLIPHEAPSSYGLAVVHWWNKIELQDIVPVERIRWRFPSPRGWWGAVGRPVPPQFAARLIEHFEGYVEGVVFKQPVAVAKGEFAKFSVSLPKRQKCFVVGNIDVERLNMELLLRDEPFCCVGITDGRIWCIGRRHTLAENTQKCYSKFQDFVLVLDLLPLYPNTRKLIALTPNDGPVDEFRAVPVELWREVFSHLDTCEQNRLRAVCCIWNGIVDLPALTDCLIAGTDGSVKGSGTSNFSCILRCMMSTVFHCLRPSTKHIILTDRQRILEMKDFLKVLHVIIYVGQRNPGIRLSAIYLRKLRCALSFGKMDFTGNCSVHHPDPAAPSILDGDWGEILLDDFIGTCGALPCDSLHLIRCRVPLSIRSYKKSAKIARYTYIPLTLTLSQVFVNTQLKLDGNFECAVWDALDGNLPVLDGDKLEKLSEELATIANNLDIQSTKARRILCATTPTDPRPSSLYRGEMWCTNGLMHLQLKNLSRITQHFLLQFMESVAPLPWHDDYSA